MRVSTNEGIVLAATIAYIAFFTHPPPTHIQDFLNTPIGHLIALLGVAYVIVYKSFIVGFFLALAYVFTVTTVTEYMDNKEQKPAAAAPPAAPQPKSNGVPPPAVKGMLESKLSKRPAPTGPKSGVAPLPPKKTSVKAPAAQAQPKTEKFGVENFASF